MNCDKCNLPKENTVGFLSTANTGYDEDLVCKCTACQFCGYIHSGECKEEDYKDIRIKDTELTEPFRMTDVAGILQSHPVEKCDCEVCRSVINTKGKTWDYELPVTGFSYSKPIKQNTFHLFEDDKAHNKIVGRIIRLVSLGLEKDQEYISDEGMLYINYLLGNLKR